MESRHWRDVKVCIGLCNSQEYVPADFFWNFLSVMKPTGCTVIRGQSRFKAAALNGIVKEAHRWKAEKILFMDVDQTFPIDVIPRLLSHNLPVVSGVTHLKVYPFSPIAGWLKDDHGINKNGKIWKYDYAPFDETENHLVEVDFTSVGCLLVDMDVFNKLYFPCFKEQWDEEQGDRKRGHDVIFCEAVKEAGYKIYLDTLVQCGHLGRLEVNDLYVKAYHNSNMHEVEAKTLKDATMERQYWDEVHFLESAKELSRDYTNEWDYIISQLEEGSSIAEIGCGRGFLMDKMIARKKCDCYGYDISKVAIDNIKNRGLKGEVADFRKPRPNGKMFDCVIASHLMEHMVDDIGFLKNISGLLKDKDGKVFISVPTANIAPVAEMEHQRVYSEETLEIAMRAVFSDVIIKSVERGDGIDSPLLIAIGSQPHEKM